MWYTLILAAVMASCQMRSSNNHETGTLHAAADSCNNPDAPLGCLFIGMPEKLSSTVTVASANEPGERLVIRGKILEADGRTPAAGLRMYLWHTNAKGLYATNGSETGVQLHHGYLHAWLKTDGNGAYEINTIRPASYPNSKIPQHIHAALWPQDGRAPFYISDFVFSDDPFVDKAYIDGIKRWNYPGGNGVVTLSKQEDVWIGERNIILNTKY